MLTLRGSLSPGSRRSYARGARPAPAPRRRAGGRVAAGRRAAVRAARRALGDRGRADRAPARAARALPDGLRRRSATGCGACCASTAPSTSPTCRRPERRRSASRARAAPGAGPWAGPAAMNRAVAGLSTNSSTLAALRADPQPPAVLVDRDHRRRPRSRRRSGRCARARRRGAPDGRDRARLDATPPRRMARSADTFPGCAARRSSRPSAPPPASPRRSCGWSRPAWTWRGSTTPTARSRSTPRRRAACATPPAAPGARSRSCRTSPARSCGSARCARTSSS